MAQASKRRLVALMVIAAVLVAVMALGFTVFGVQRWLFGTAANPPGVGTITLAPLQSKAQQALERETMDADERAATEYLAAQPTAYWLTPEQDPIGVAGRTVLGLTDQARKQGVSLSLVIYGLPERDCGNHSAGGLTASDYQRWVNEIATALDAAPDLQKIVILEPDSLALAPECGNLEERAPQLGAAVQELHGPDVWIYLDGGHSGWLPAREMAGLIDAVGVSGKVRGFATNVSNYRATIDEFAYAREVADHLDGMHAVIDTSRNGVASAGAEWCNPPGQRVGDPGGTFGDDVVDTNLWIKPPGESDGPCHGAPAAGVWWPQGALALTAGVR